MVDAVISISSVPQAEFAGYLVAEHLNLGTRRGVRLRAVPRDTDKNPLDAVIAGKAEFGVASPAQLLTAKDPGEFRWLMTFQQESPFVYPVRKESPVKTVRDLVGRAVAVQPGGDDLELRWMVLRAGADADGVDRVIAADMAAAFVANEVASAQMTVYREMRDLEAKGLTRDRLRLFKAADNKSALIKDGLFTSRRLVESNPDHVQRVVDTAMEGWARAFADADTAAEIAAERRGFGKFEQARQLADIRALCFRQGTLTHGLGYPDANHVKRAAQALADLGEPADDAAVAALRDMSFWRDSPAEFKRKG